MASNQKQITDSLRAEWTATFKAFVDNNFNTDVCQTAAGTFMFPVPRMRTRPMAPTATASRTSTS